MQGKKEFSHKLKIILYATLLCVVVIGGIMLFRKMSEPKIPDDAKTLKVKIVSVNIYEGGATIEVLNNGKVDGIYLQKATVIEDADGKECSYEDLEAGQMIEAIVAPEVIHRAWENVTTGKPGGMQIFNQCYKVVIK